MDAIVLELTRDSVDQVDWALAAWFLLLSRIAARLKGQEVN